MEREQPRDAESGPEGPGEPGAPETGSGACSRVGELYRVWHEAYRELEQWEASQGSEAVQTLREMIRQDEGSR